MECDGVKDIKMLKTGDITRENYHYTCIKNIDGLLQKLNTKHEGKSSTKKVLGKHFILCGINKAIITRFPKKE